MELEQELEETLPDDACYASHNLQVKLASLKFSFILPRFSKPAREIFKLISSQTAKSQQEYKRFRDSSFFKSHQLNLNLFNCLIVTLL